MWILQGLHIKHAKEFGLYAAGWGQWKLTERKAGLDVPLRKMMLLHWAEGGWAAITVGPEEVS